MKSLYSTQMSLAVMWGHLVFRLRVRQEDIAHAICNWATAKTRLVAWCLAETLRSLDA